MTVEKRKFKSVVGWRRICVFSALGAAIFCNVWMSFRQDSHFAFLKEVVIDKDESRVFLVVGLDRFLDKAAPTGNIVLRFNGFQTNKKESEDAGRLLIYFRSVYRLYPRRVFAVSANTIVNTPDDLDAHPFNPSLEWMRKHGVSKRITFTKDVQGNIRTRIISISGFDNSQNSDK